MKAYLIALCLIVGMGSAIASPSKLDGKHIGIYHAVSHSSDLGKIWVSWGELVGDFNDTYLVLKDGYRIEYKRVCYSEYNGTKYIFIQVNLNDIIEITDMKHGMVMLQYLQNGKEVERYICKVNNE